MSNINPNCDGSHCRHGYKEVRNYNDEIRAILSA
jgi:CDGSH-type Zn-finger protein